MVMPRFSTPSIFAVGHSELIDEKPKIASKTHLFASRFSAKAVSRTPRNADTISPVHIILYERFATHIKFLNGMIYFRIRK